MLHKATIAGITMDPATNTPIIILKTDEGGQAVPFGSVCSRPRRLLRRCRTSNSIAP